MTRTETVTIGEPLPRIESVAAGDGAAAQLGISRQQVTYYSESKSIPRYIALACANLDGTHHC
jgi:hypothetical protein